MRFVYHYTKDGSFLGPGSMFVAAATLYLVAIYCAYALPVRCLLAFVDRITALRVFLTLSLLVSG